MTLSSPASQDAGIQKVGNLELFLDLVFVFTVTQITGTLAHPHGPETYLHAALMFLSLMWSYDGYCWLASNTGLTGDLEGWLTFVTMAGFFMMALAIPAVWSSPAAGALFGAGLIVATVIHLVLFSHAPNGSAQAIFGVGFTNLLSAVLVLLSSFCNPGLKTLLWGAALLVILLPIFFTQADRGFSLSPKHFAERHGLLVIIALGESIMGVGLGIARAHLHGLYLGYALIALLLVAFLWWSYFGPDNQRAEHALVKADPTRRSQMALRGYGLAHFTMLAGIILAAAGLEVGVHDPAHPVHGWAAWNLGGGLALYFAGDVLFRRAMGLGPGRLRSGLALMLLATAWVGLHFPALWQLLSCTALIFAAVTFEDYVLDTPAPQEHTA